MGNVGWWAAQLNERSKLWIRTRSRRCRGCGRRPWACPFCLGWQPPPSLPTRSLLPTRPAGSRGVRGRRSSLATSEQNRPDRGRWSEGNGCGKMDASSRQIPNPRIRQRRSSSSETEVMYRATCRLSPDCGWTRGKTASGRGRESVSAQIRPVGTDTILCSIRGDLNSSMTSLPGGRVSRFLTKPEHGTG